jgi:5-methylcytosine-specific restriction protein A
MTRNPTWSRDELILALDLYMRHRERLPDNDNHEIIQLSQTLNSLFGDKAKDTTLFRNPNGVYMKLANFRAIDHLHTSQGKRGLSRGGHGTEEIWTEFSERPDELQLIAAAIRSAVGVSILPADEEEIGYAEAAEGRLLTRLHRSRERDRNIVRRKRESVLRETGHLACEACGLISKRHMGHMEAAS